MSPIVFRWKLVFTQTGNRKTGSHWKLVGRQLTDFMANEQNLHFMRPFELQAVYAVGENCLLLFCF